MNSRIRCENCIYWDTSISLKCKESDQKMGYCLQARAFGNVKIVFHNVEAKVKDVPTYSFSECIHFTDKDNGKTFKDYYFEENPIECKCEHKECDYLLGQLIGKGNIDATNCPIHNKGEK